MSGEKIGRWPMCYFDDAIMDDTIFPELSVRKATECVEPDPSQSALSRRCGHVFRCPRRWGTAAAAMAVVDREYPFASPATPEA